MEKRCCIQGPLYSVEFVLTHQAKNNLIKTITRRALMIRSESTPDVDI